MVWIKPICCSGTNDAENHWIAWLKTKNPDFERH